MSYTQTKSNNILYSRPYIVIPFLALLFLISVLLIANFNTPYNLDIYGYSIPITYTITNNTLVLNITNTFNDSIIIKKIVIDNDRVNGLEDTLLEPSETLCVTYVLEDNTTKKNILGRIVSVTIVYEYHGVTYRRNMFIPIVRED